MRSRFHARRDAHPMRGASTRNVLFVVLAVMVLVFVGQQVLHPVYAPCAVCEHTGRRSCGAEGCVHGSVPCPGDCIKADDPGWTRMAVDGHPPDEMWLRFEHPRGGGYAAWTRAHIGEVVALVDGRYVNQGRCPLCAGTSRVACSACNAAQTCASCRGRGRHRRWLPLP